MTSSDVTTPVAGKGTFGSPSFGPGFSSQIAIDAYTAGLFDGEGHLQVTPGGIGLKIMLLDEPVIDWLVSTLGGSKNGQPARGNQPRAGFNWWQGKMHEVNRILTSWLPYLQIKGDEARAGITYNEHRIGLPKLHPSQSDYEENTIERVRLRLAVVEARHARHASYGRVPSSNS